MHVHTCLPVSLPLSALVRVHVRRSPIERARLSLERLEPLLVTQPPVVRSRQAVVDRVLPPSWRLNVDTARWVCSPCARRRACVHWGRR